MSVVRLASHKDFKKMIKAARDGRNVNIPSALGNTALHFAIKNDHYAAIYILLKKGAKLNHKNNEKVSPLDILYEKDKGKNYYLHLTMCIIIALLEFNNFQYLNVEEMNTTLKLSLSVYKYSSEKDQILEIMTILILNGANIDLISDKDLKEYLLAKYNEMIIKKSKERSKILREELTAKYHSPENIEQWSVYYNKPFDEVIEIM
jgi:ankyrin repeat protein